MSQTQVPANSAIERKLYSVALFAQQTTAPGFSRNISGPIPKSTAAMAKMKGQSSPDMPIVRITDLAQTAGGRVTMDMFNTVRGKPTVGDTNAEGTGAALSYSSMEIGIDLVTKVVDAGGKMAQQRTIHQLRDVAMAQLRDSAFFSHYVCTFPP